MGTNPKIIDYRKAAIVNASELVEKTVKAIVENEISDASQSTLLVFTDGTYHVTGYESDCGDYYSIAGNVLEEKDIRKPIISLALGIISQQEFDEHLEEEKQYRKREEARQKKRDEEMERETYLRLKVKYGKEKP